MVHKDFPKAPEYDPFHLPATYWITADLSVGKELKAIGVTWKVHTGTQFQGCKVPEGKVIELWDLWNRGLCMFGAEGEAEAPSRDGARLKAEKDGKAKTVPKGGEAKRKPARRKTE